MSTFNTGNPVPSTDVRDLYDNAQNFDTALNTRSSETWLDRLNVPRLSWYGAEQKFDRFMEASSETFQEFLLSSGYVDLGDYAAGLEITARNQIFRKDGELYRASADLELPYTLTGVWEDESDFFVSVGDAALRQELGSAGGAEIVYYKDPRPGSVSRPIADIFTGNGINLKNWGAKGDYATDDTEMIRSALAACAEISGTLLVPPGMYRCTDGITVPKNVAVLGVGSPILATFPDRYGDKAYLRPGYKHLMPGACFVFSGTGVAAATTVRAAPFDSFRYAVQLTGGNSSVRWRGVGVCQDMDVLDAEGNLTPYGDHNPADYDVGMFVNDSVHGHIESHVFGYWPIGVLNYGDDPDQNTFTHGASSGQRGFVSLGTGTAGLSGNNLNDWDLYSAEYHLRSADHVGICALQIDGGGFNISGHYIHGGRINTYAVTPVILNSCREVWFYGTVMETTFIPPDQTSAAVKFISEDGQVDRVGFVGCRWSNNPVYGADRLSGQITGSIFFMGGPPGVNPNSLIELCINNKVAKIRANTTGYDLQLAGDPSSSNSGVVFRNPGDNNLQIIANNVTVATLSADGIFAASAERSGKKRLVRAAAVVVGGAFTFTRSWSILTSGTGSGTTLNTINGGVEGDEVLLTSGLTAEPITVTSTGGNIRIGADFVVTGTTSLRLVFSGSVWQRAN